MNKYPWWAYFLIIVTFLLGCLYAAPNLYVSDPVIQITTKLDDGIDESVLDKSRELLKDADIPVKSMAIENNQGILRFHNTNEQLQAIDLIRAGLGSDYNTALNLLPSTPKFLRDLNAQPMFLGLDLRGGVHFLMEVDTEAAKEKALERMNGEFRDFMREAKVKYLSVLQVQDQVIAKFRTEADRDAGEVALRNQYRHNLVYTHHDGEKSFDLVAVISETYLRSIEKFALEQNITTLRKRVNELGVAEPVIQQQGNSRIVVQLPGVQDTTYAKEILGAIATLEFRLVDEVGTASYRVSENSRIPAGNTLFKDRDGRPILLKNRVMLTGEYITGAAAGLDENNLPSVFIDLDGKGAKRFSIATGANIDKQMAVVYIETKFEESLVNGEIKRKKVVHKEVINVAQIRAQLSHRFQITGLDSPAESSHLALLLRSGALAAPVYIVEERTIGPNLGQENIEKGFNSIIIGFLLVLLFMLVYYKMFGLVANISLAMNVVFIFAMLSLMQATLTLPGIAGIVLTIGMAVDANTLIFERIKEELRLKTPIQTAIKKGYDQAFLTIIDANVTTLIAAIVLFVFGTGPIKGFAITLALGIVSSMFTSVIVSRSLVNLIYGGRKRLKSLSI